MRKFVSEVIYPEAVKCEDNGKRISQEVVDKIWYILSAFIAGMIVLTYSQREQHFGYAHR